MKSQVNQMFIFIFSLIIIGVVVLVGVKSIGGLVEDKCTVDYVTFQDKIIEAISLSNDYGSVKQHKIPAPCDFDVVCMADFGHWADPIDPNHQGAVSTIKNAPAYNVKELMKMSVNDGVQKNVFAMKSDEVRPAGYAEELQVSPTDVNDYDSDVHYTNDRKDIICIESKNGYFTFKTRGLGRYTLVMKPDGANP